MNPFLRMVIIAAALGSTLVPAAHAQGTAAVSGIVSDGLDGQPLAGARVTLAIPGMTDLVSGAATDLAGQYLVADVAPGNYVLTMTFDGYRPARFQVSLTAGESRTVNASLALSDIGLNTFSVVSPRLPREEDGADAKVDPRPLSPLENAASRIAAAVSGRNRGSVKKGQVNIVAIYGRQRLEAGEAENFRVRVAPGARWPIEYQWNLGDGTLATGNNIVHRFQRPGQYPVVVSARNSAGTDTDTLTVLVVRPRGGSALYVADAEPDLPEEMPQPRERNIPAKDPPPLPPPVHPGNTALYSPGGIAWQQGGYTWVAATSLNRRIAENLARQYHEEGYRAGVFVDDSGRGSTAYRVVLGQFASEKQALAVRAQLLKKVPNNILLLHLPTKQ